MVLPVQHLQLGLLELVLQEPVLQELVPVQPARRGHSQARQAPLLVVSQQELLVRARPVV